MADTTVLTMADIARLAGVSESTVSRALQDNPNVSKATRTRIQQLVLEQGYKINPVASSLRSRKTNTIAVVLPLQHESKQHISDPFFIEMLGHIADAVSDRGYDLLLSKIATTQSDWLNMMVRARRADGIIIIGQSSQHDRLNEAASFDMPFVVWGAQLPDQNYATVGSDNRTGGFLAVDHLISRGCKRIAFLGDKRLPEIAARYLGYTEALAKNGIPVVPELEVLAHFESADAMAEVSVLIESGIAFDGFIAASDVIAMSAIRSLNEHGKRVPEDVAVVGFDDIGMAAYTSPPLTTVKQDLALGGKELVRLLLDQINGKPVESVVLPTRLILRKSGR
jgi:DNA-binding LacI/PurR family transcriptional regulator